MKILSLSFLALAVLWGLSVVSHDQATKKITNASVLAGLKLLALGAACYAALTWLGLAGQLADYPPAAFYRALAVHLALTAAAGCSLWYAGMWPAGDAKFYMVLTAALPLADPGVRGLPNQLFLIVLINTFVAASFWAVGSYFASGLFSSSFGAFLRDLGSGAKGKLMEFSERNNKFVLAGYFFSVTLTFLLHQVTMREAGGLLRPLVRAEIFYFFLFVLWDRVGDLVRTNGWRFALAVAYAAYFAAGWFLFREHLLAMISGSLLNAAKFSVVLVIGRFTLVRLLEKKDVYLVGADAVEPGMVPSERFERVLKRRELLGDDFGDVFRDGLSEEQAGLLRKWLSVQEGPAREAEMVRGKPFAVWIFAGAMLALVYGRTLASGIF